jgi:uncharacterized protein YkwD
VARVWAKKLLLADACKHGDPGARLRAAGYTSGTWGENIGCGNGYRNAHYAVLLSHLRFQAEKSTGGGHWKNIKNARFKYIGIGVWKGYGRVRLVTDFYSW